MKKDQYYVRFNCHSNVSQEMSLYLIDVDRDSTLGNPKRLFLYDTALLEIPLIHVMSVEILECFSIS